MIQKEYGIMQACDHPNIVKVKGPLLVETDDNGQQRAVMGLERLKGGSLFDFLHWTGAFDDHMCKHYAM